MPDGVVGAVNFGVQIAGKTFPYRKNVVADGVAMKEKVVPAAKVGSLTTRTNDTTGTLTMEAGHGFQTGNRLDLYWDGGTRRGVAAGTVATNSVPISGGAGDNLPSQGVAIRAMVPVEEAIEGVGDDLYGIFLYSNLAGQIVLAESDNTEHLHRAVGAPSGGEQSYAWWDEGFFDNPVAGDQIDKVFFSHGDADESAIMRVALLTD